MLNYQIEKTHLRPPKLFFIGRLELVDVPLGKTYVRMRGEIPEELTRLLLHKKI